MSAWQRRFFGKSNKPAEDIKICHETAPIKIALIRADNPDIGNEIRLVQVRRYDDEERHGYTHWIELSANTDNGQVAMIYNYHPRAGWSLKSESQ